MSFDPADLTINQKAVLLTLSKLPPQSRHDRRFFEKLLFLVTKAQPELLEDIEDTFEGYRMGPYSEFVDELSHHLEDFGLIKRMDLTGEGRTVAQKLAHDREIAPVLESLDETLNLARDFDVNDLLYLVYKLYPPLAERSEFPEEARSDKLEHFSIPVSRLAEGQSITVSSDKGGSVNATLRNGRLVLTPIH